MIGTVERQRCARRPSSVHSQEHNISTHKSTHVHWQAHTKALTSHHYTHALTTRTAHKQIRTHRLHRHKRTNIAASAGRQTTHAQIHTQKYNLTTQTTEHGQTHRRGRLTLDRQADKQDSQAKLTSTFCLHVTYSQRRPTGKQTDTWTVRLSHKATERQLRDSETNKQTVRQ